MELPAEYVAYLEANLNLAERVTQAFSGLDERLDYTNLLLTKLLEAQGSQPSSQPLIDALSNLSNVLSSLSIGSVLPNRSTFVTGLKQLTTANTAEQLTTSSIPIPDGFGVTVVACQGNSGYISVGPTKSDAEGGQRFYSLDPTYIPTLYLQVTNVNLIWVMPSSANDWVSWIVPGMAVGAGEGAGGGGSLK